MTPMTPRKRNVYLTVVGLGVLALVLVLVNQMRQPGPGVPGKNVRGGSVNIPLRADGQPGNCTLSFVDKEDMHLLEYEGTWDTGASQSRHSIRYRLQPGASDCAKGRLIIGEFRKVSSPHCPAGGGGDVTRDVFVSKEASGSDPILEVRTANLPSGIRGTYCYDIRLQLNGVTSPAADPEIEIVW
ncbi:MAG TPA: hypothetical protein VK886_04525 [Vicinamibacterales bacterium]|nr:hypothetical protein [Vicinamibacterales bacterium]